MSSCFIKRLILNNNKITFLKWKHTLESQPTKQYILFYPNLFTLNQLKVKASKSKKNRFVVTKKKSVT
jgi:hypothetical protein